MNRYGRGGSTIGAPSKANPNTTCQKCLKKGHYSYECKATAQERPYVSRPSRTQQLLNPKLVPKLSSDAPKELMRKKGIADEHLAKLEQERGRKRERQSEEADAPSTSKRMRSASSSSSSISVSTISTRSPSPAPGRREAQKSHSPQRPASSYRPVSTGKAIHSERKRRRDSISSADSYMSDEDQSDSRRRSRDRTTRRKFQEASPPIRGRRTESRSRSRTPRHVRRALSNDRKRISGVEQLRLNDPPRDYRQASPPRERSLSPFSKRQALTRAMAG